MKETDSLWNALKRSPLIVMGCPLVALLLAIAAMEYEGPTYHTTGAIRVTPTVTGMASLTPLVSDVIGTAVSPQDVVAAFEAYAMSAQFLQGVQALGPALSKETEPRLQKTLGLVWTAPVLTISGDGRSGEAAATLVNFATAQFHTFAATYTQETVSGALQQLEATLQVDEAGLTKAVSLDQANLAAAATLVAQEVGAAPSGTAVSGEVILRLDPTYQAALATLAQDQEALSAAEGDGTAVQNAASVLAASGYGLQAFDIGAPVLPTRPIGPRAKLDSALAIMLGGVVGIVWAVSRASNQARDSEDRA